MVYSFYKFDGAGNDFIIIDNREVFFHADPKEVAAMCHRRFGIGADGLMTIESAPEGYDFEMRYYNSDGHLGSMCGNGGRCIAAFAHHLGMGSRLSFLAYDGEHHATIKEWNPRLGTGSVELSMRDINAQSIRSCLNGKFIDTGSPHYVQQVEDLEHYDVVAHGGNIRHMADIFPQGTNVDFIEPRPDGQLFVRTYERGVEDETWACGTGVTACAILTGCHSIVMRGGSFVVDFQQSADTIHDIHLTGPVSLNFTGQWTSSAV